jgi:hypothetical protein
MPYSSVRASRLEQTRALPGDELIRDPIASLTHAITIQRPPRDVWPWLVQMGAGNRAGWYSYDFIDNGRRPSADRIVPALQTVAAGDLFPAAPGATEGFHVLEFETARYLVLGVEARAWDRADHDLGIRARVAHRHNDASDCPGSRWTRVSLLRSPVDGLGKPFIRFGHFVMQRKQLLGHRRAGRVAGSEPNCRAN